MLTDNLQPRIALAGFSLCVLFIAQFFFMFSHDLFYDRYFYQTLTEAFEYDSWNSIENLIIVALFAVPLTIWHICDLLFERKPNSWMSASLGSYKLILSVLLFGLVGFAVSASGLIERMQCRNLEVIETDSGNKFGFLCHPDPTLGFTYLVLPSVFVLLLLALANVCALAIQKFKKAK